MTASGPEREAMNPAEVYERFFVPALFHGWADQVAGAAALEPGQHVLDVASGTGVLARAAAAQVGPEGSVVGLDANPEMLAVARRQAPQLAWREGRAEDLPFEDGTFDAVLSQFGLTFFTDRQAALREMMRVLKRGGRLTVAVFDELGHAPGYAALTRLLERLFGPEIAQAMHPPFLLGDVAGLRALFARAGVADATVTTQAGQVRFPSVDAMIGTERACVWTLGGLLDEDQFELLRREAGPALRPFVGDGGSVRFPISAHLVRATKA